MIDSVSIGWSGEDFVTGPPTRLAYYMTIVVEDWLKSGWGPVGIVYNFGHQARLYMLAHSKVKAAHITHTGKLE